MAKVIPTDIYDKEGNLLKIEFNDLEGNHVLDAHWDSNDEQTSENRIAFREWAYVMVKRTKNEVIS